MSKHTNQSLGTIAKISFLMTRLSNNYNILNGYTNESLTAMHKAMGNAMASKPHVPISNVVQLVLHAHTISAYMAW